MMKNLLPLLLLVSSITVVTRAASAQDSCAYCGIWVPYGQEYASIYTSNDRLTITEQKIALPGCSPMKATEVFLTHQVGYGAPESANPRELKAILKITWQDNCASSTLVQPGGALAEIWLWPWPYKDSERLRLEIFAPTSLEEIKTSYTYELVPTPAGQKQMMKHPPRPKVVGGWWFIREKYDPCAEGTGQGAQICAAINYKKTDESMNAEWTHLLSAIPEDDKQDLISIQKRWLRACEKECAKSFGEAGSYQWGSASYTSCLADERIKRAWQLTQLYECIRNGRLDCMKLDDKP